MIYLVTTQKQIFNLPSNIVFASIPECINYCEKLTSIGVDTETTGFDPHTCEILSLQLGDSQNQYVIDLSSVSISCFKELLETKELILQNAKFDLKFLYKHNIIPTKLYDTYLAEMVLSTGKINHRRGLDFLVKRYCVNVTLDKEIRGVIHKEGLSSRVIKYAADDVAFLHEIREKQEKKIQEEGSRMALKLDNWCVRSLAYIEFCGIYLDTKKWLNKCEEDLSELSKITDELDNWVTENKPEYTETQYDMFSEGLPCAINWNSPKQIIPLFKELGVNTTVDDKGNIKDSIDAKVLDKQKNKHPLIQTYLKYSGIQKLTSTYGKEFLKSVNKITGRVHTTYKQIMNTGRMSSGETNKKIGLKYPNMQNIPSDTRHRSCFAVEPGNKMIVSDYSSQESRILAEYSKEPNLVNFYLSGEADLHSYATKLVFSEETKGLNLKEVKKQFPDKRQLMKGYNFALAYGGTAVTVSNNLNIPLSLAEETEVKYFEAFPGLKSYFKKAAAQPVKDGYVLINNVTGRKSYIDFYKDFKRLDERIDSDFWTTYRAEKAKNSDLFNHELKPLVRDYFRKKGMIERRGLNFPIQGSAADMTKLALCYIFDWILENNYFNIVKIVQVTHDEIGCEAPEELAEDVALVVKESMEKAGKVFCKTIPIEAEPEISSWWTH